MEITRIDSDPAAVLALSGRLDGRNPAILKEQLAKELQSRNRIILDLAKLTYIDSSGLGVLVGTLKKAINQQGDIRLVNPSAEVRMLLELTRVDKVFLIYPDLQAALRSCSEDNAEYSEARNSG